jgi:hypothetical protein
MALVRLVSRALVDLVYWVVAGMVSAGLALARVRAELVAANSLTAAQDLTALSSSQSSMPDPKVIQLLGRIDGKLDQVIESAKEHRDDDTRRFTEIHGRLDEHAEDINKAKGAKGALLWAAGLVAGGVSIVAAYAVKALGLH